MKPTPEYAPREPLTDEELQVLRQAIREGIGTMPGSYVGGVLETIVPVFERMLAVRLQSQADKP